MSTFNNGIIVNTEAKKSKSGNSMVVFSISLDINKKARQIFVMKNEKMVERINKMLGSDYKKVDDIVKIVRNKSLVGTEVSCLMVEDTFLNEKSENVKYMKLANFYPKFTKDNAIEPDLTPVAGGDMPF